MGEHDGLELFPVILIGVAAIAALVLILSPNIHTMSEQGSLVGAAYADIGEVPAQFAPPWNVFTNEAFLFLAANSSGGNVSLNVTAAHDGMLFFKRFFVATKHGWEVHDFDETPDYGGYWIFDEATAHLSLDASEFEPDSWVIVYACSLVDREWRCGCFSKGDTLCHKWSIQEFSPDVCADDAVCVGHASGESFCDGDALLSCAAGADGCLDLTNTTCPAGEHCLVSGTTVKCDSCAASPPAPSTVDCGTNSTGTLCNGTGYNVTGEKCASGKICVVSGTSMECVSCSASPPDPDTVDCGTNGTGLLCNGTGYSVPGEKCASGMSCVNDECVTTWWRDQDGDGYGDLAVSVQADTKPSGYVADSTDCDDSDAQVHPGATETCDGKDDNCDGQVDEGSMLCDDGNSCTSDACGGASGCTHTNVADGTSCSPPTGGKCNAGTCVLTGCTSECDPATYSPSCGFDASWHIYQTVCRDDNGDGCDEIVQDLCGADQYCDKSKGGCYDPSCGDGIKQWEEECDDGGANGPCPATCSASCTLNNCGSADGDTSESACQAAPDQTTDHSSCLTCNPKQLAFDYGIDWLDPWPSGAEGTEKCCGDDANEWLLYDEGNAAIKSCCNAYTDCVDSSGACKTHNALYGGKFCYDDWWYNCNSGTRCKAHTDPSLDPTPTKDCYYQNGAYAWGDYSTPPAEECDGVDNDCDGQVDEGCQTDLVAGDLYQAGLVFYVKISPASFSERPPSLSISSKILFSSTGRNTVGRTFYATPSPKFFNPSWYWSTYYDGSTPLNISSIVKDDYLTLQVTLDPEHHWSQPTANDVVTEVVPISSASLDGTGYELSHCGGHGEWPCDSNNHGKWCGGVDAGACGVTCDAGYTFCPATNGCWASCS